MTYSEWKFVKLDQGPFFVSKGDTLNVKFIVENPDVTINGSTISGKLDYNEEGSLEVKGVWRRYIMDDECVIVAVELALNAPALGGPLPESSQPDRN